ncbi:MAG: hypothetical protein NVS9B4_28200 [Candidatus Acidiferrum sp.]
MKRMTLFFVVVLLAAGAASAHGKEQHVMGMLTAIADNSITVRTTTGKSVTLYTMTDTKYEKSGTVASRKDLDVGDRVVIHAMKMNDKLMATEVRFRVGKQASPKA